MSQVPPSIADQAIDELQSMQQGQQVSPSGKSIIESVASGEEDPTVSQFQGARGDFFKGIVDFFEGILKCNFVGIPCWIIIVAVIILILVAIIRSK